VEFGGQNVKGALAHLQRRCAQSARRPLAEGKGAGHLGGEAALLWEKPLGKAPLRL